MPLGKDADLGQLAQRLGLPVIPVLGMRPGCLNHALLTAKAVRAPGVTLAGWIANYIDPEMAVADQSVHALKERIGAPRLALIAFRHEIDSADVAALPDLEPLA
ncbi:MAG: hypothetical protein FJY51_01110 [Betaproteobacteria bacterium]|nr:hypothetical protein [Betaproteobacteria bacterium]